MAKNKKPQNSLLNESTVRRFMQLADIPELTNTFLSEESSDKWGHGARQKKRHRNKAGVETATGDVDHHYDDYEDDTGEKKGDESSTHPGRRDYMKEESEEESELHATEDELGAEDDVADEEADELDAESGEGEAEITPEAAEAIIDLAAQLEASGAAEGGEAVEAEIETNGDTVEAEVEELDEFKGLEEQLAKLGIEVVDDKVIKEAVYKRVIKRLTNEQRRTKRARQTDQLVERIFSRLQKASKRTPKKR